MNTILSVASLLVRFKTPSGNVTAVNDVSFNIKKGETLAIVGESGCGKSTVARSILALPGKNAVISGTVRYKDKNLLTLSKKEMTALRGSAISIILQNPDLALNPVIPIGRQIIEPLKHHFKIDSRRAIEISGKALEQMGFERIDDLLKKYPFQLSGGMNQRILIAAAMLTNPELIIADEPTRALDPSLKDRVKEELVKAKRENGCTMLLITHDLGLASALADRVAVMYAGELVEITGTGIFFREPLHPYSKMLLKSLPGKGFCSNVPPVFPSMIRPQSGCRFYPRCSFKTPECGELEPAVTGIEKGEVRCLLYA